MRKNGLKAQFVRIPKLTNDAVIQAFFGRKAKNYYYSVSREEFDEYDVEGPGEHYGVEVPRALAQKWDAGLDVCKEVGEDPQSRDGYLLRIKSMHGESAELPRELERWLRKRDAAVQAKVEAERVNKEELEKYESLKAGFSNVGLDEYSGRYWNLAERKTLELLGEYRGRESRRALYRLPNGDLFEIIGNATWARWTKDADLVADRNARREIKGYVYEPRLLSALVELANKGALDAGGYTWFGGSAEAIRRQGYESAYSGVQNGFGAEKRAKLKRFIEQCLCNPRLQEQHEELRSALKLVKEGSIRHIGQEEEASLQRAEIEAVRSTDPARAEHLAKCYGLNV